jgi:succinate dehydrogenase/fumarate reductase cytochrome b subunit
MSITRHQAFLQRATGFATLAFLGYHLATLRIPLALGHLAPTDLGPTLVASLSSTTESGIPAHAVAYLLGTGAASYHLAMGLTTFSATWELAVSEAAILRIRIASGLAGAALFAAGALTVIHYATGSTFGLGG